MAKGFMGELAPIISTFFLLAIVFIFFFSWLTLTSKDRVTVIEGATSHLVVTQELLSLLQTPYKGIPLVDALAFSMDKKENMQPFYDFIFPLFSLFPHLDELCGWFFTLESRERQELSVHSFLFSTTTIIKGEQSFTLSSYINPKQVYHGGLGIECSQY